MIWLAGQLWPLLVVSAVLGAACVALWGPRRVTVEEWQEVPVTPEPAAADEADDEEPGTTPGPAASTSVTAPLEVDADDPTSPFPGAAPGRPAPWEEEELWSRPARVGASGQVRRPKDEWTEAAESWRSWADEAAGRGAPGPSGHPPLDPTDRDLFAADRATSKPSEGGAATDGPGPGTGPVGGTRRGRETMGRSPAGRPGDGSAQPRPRDDDVDGDVGSDVDDLDDDEREAAEIRRMRERERRGEAG